MIKVKVMDILDTRERNIKWLSTKTGITYSTIYNFVTGKTVAVSYNLLESISKVLNVEISDIIEIIPDITNNKK